MIDLDETTAKNMAFAEGFEDGQKGDNYNPFDDVTQHDQWDAYENGYLKGVMDGWKDVVGSGG
jgi:hypothetical protein